MSDVIKQLPDHVANQIAAGEVVQRPASVVKELLENAVDAGASRIDLIFKEGGKTLIQVTDDGVGMSAIDAPLAFNRHATSKISKADDLFNIHTKGFRGEALASIAAIAHVEMKTRREQDELGTEVRIEGGQIVNKEAVVAPVGTTIAVKNLFYNIPARRNFLKSEAVETRHILDEFHRVALAHPGLSFTARHNGNLLFDLPAANLRQRIVGVFGKKTNEKLVPVSEQTDIVRVSGFVVKPRYARKSRGEQFFFVNDRFIKSAYLHHSIVSGFEGLLADKQQPGYFLYLEVDPTTIDINIHPTKTEIKFENEHAIYAMMRAMVKHALGQFSVAPSLDFDQDSSLEPSYADQKRLPRQPRIEVDKSFNPFGKEGGQGYVKTVKRDPSWEALYVGIKETSDHLGGQQTPSEITIESDEVDGRLFDKEADPEAVNIFFQVQNKYIVTPLKGGVVVVNQHLAHRRILYEQLLRKMAQQQVLSQQLLFPVRLTFGKDEITLLEDLGEQLEYSGLSLLFEDGESVEIAAVPQGLKPDELPGLFEQLVADVRQEVPEARIDFNELLARNLARSMAVKTGTSLSMAEQEDLIDRLFSCDQPALSPENKPLMVRLDAGDLDKKFA